MKRLLAPPAACHATSIWPFDPDAEILCPERQVVALEATPWVGPQPADDICDSCTSDCCSISNFAVADAMPKTSSVSHGTLRIEIPADEVRTLGAPTIVTDQAIYRLHPGMLPCLAPGSRCVVHNIPHGGEGPIGLVITVSESNQPCENDASQPCWSHRSNVLALP